MRNFAHVHICTRDRVKAHICLDRAVGGKHNQRTDPWRNKNTVKRTDNNRSVIICDGTEIRDHTVDENIDDKTIASRESRGREREIQPRLTIQMIRLVCPIQASHFGISLRRPCPPTAVCQVVSSTKKCYKRVLYTYVEYSTRSSRQSWLGCCRVGIRITSILGKNSMTQ